MPTIPSTSPLTGGGATSAQKTTSSTMGKDDFLKLMTTQLRRQDPMKPVDDTAFLAQMAQFTSLEQLTNLGTTAGQQLNAQAVSQALALAGKTVDYVGSDGSTHTGVVDAVGFDGGVPQLTIGGVPGISPGAVAAVHGGTGGTTATTSSTGATPAPTTSTTPSSTATGGDATTTNGVTP